MNVEPLPSIPNFSTAQNKSMVLTFSKDAIGHTTRNARYTPKSRHMGSHIAHVTAVMTAPISWLPFIVVSLLGRSSTARSPSDVAMFVGMLRSLQTQPGDVTKLVWYHPALRNNELAKLPELSRSSLYLQTSRTSLLSKSSAIFAVMS